MRKITLLVLLLVFLLALSGHAETPFLLSGVPSITGNRDSSVRFDLVGHYIVVKTRLSGADKEYSFVLDSGSTVTLIDKKVLTEIKAKKTQTFSVEDAGNTATNLDAYMVDAITVGGVEVKDNPVLAYDMASFDFGCRVDGVIGVTYLRFFCTYIDYKTKQVTFSRKPSSEKGGYSYNNTGRDAIGLLQVPVTIDGHTMQATIDTGAARTIVDYNLLEQLAYPKEERVHITGNIGYQSAFGGTGKDLFARLKSVDICGIKLSDYVVGSYGSEGALIGFGFLSQCKLILDYLDNKVVFVPYSDANFKLSNWSVQWLKLKLAEGDKVVVEGLCEGTPPAKLGVQIGDLVKTINGKDASSYTQAQMDSLAKSGMEVTILTKDGKQVTFTAKTEDLFPVKS